MKISAAPKDYEELITLIHARHGEMSKTYQRIAEFLTQNPHDVAVSTVSAIAHRQGIHASSFVRFAQALGFSGFKDLQALFQARLTTAAPGFEARIKALEAELDDPKGDIQYLHELVLRDMAALQDLLETSEHSDMTRAADMMERAQTIYLLGQLRSAPVVQLLSYVLTMLGKPNVILSDGGGLATHRAKLAQREDLLLAVSFRFYATEVVNIVEACAARNVPILGISDSTLSPLARDADLLFALPEHEHSFSRSLAAPMCLAQSLCVALAARLRPEGPPRIPTVTQP